jgi:ribosomal protein S18 acetylase RimI-like enzyme
VLEEMDVELMEQLIHELSEIFPDVHIYINKICYGRYSIYKDNGKITIFSIILDGIRENEDSAHIMSLEINEKYRKIGFGSKIYKIIENYLKSKGYKSIDLIMVREDAIDFWKKMGFVLKNGKWRKNIQ